MRGDPSCYAAPLPATVRIATGNMDSDGGGEETPANNSPVGDQMTSISLHFFGDDEHDADAFSIQIIENMKEEYGLFVWPSSIALAEYVWQQRSRFSGTSVVELGAGTSLPGLVASKVGAEVTLTDDSNRVEVLGNIRKVCDLNKLQCKVAGLTWGVWDAHIFDLHPQIILGADVLYETSAFDNLFSTVAFLLQKNPGSVFITAYHNRSGHHLIEFLMVKWGLKCIKLVDAFSFMPSDKAAGVGGNIQLAEIVLDNQHAFSAFLSSAQQQSSITFSFKEGFCNKLTKSADYIFILSHVGIVDRQLYPS